MVTGSIMKVNPLLEANRLVERELFPLRSSFIPYLHLGDTADPWVFQWLLSASLSQSWLTEPKQFALNVFICILVALGLSLLNAGAKFY